MAGRWGPYFYGGFKLPSFTEPEQLQGEFLDVRCLDCCGKMESVHENKFTGIEGVERFLNDVIIYGSTFDEILYRLETNSTIDEINLLRSNSFRKRSTSPYSAWTKMIIPFRFQGYLTNNGDFRFQGNFQIRGENTSYFLNYRAYYFFYNMVSPRMM